MNLENPDEPTTEEYYEDLLAQAFDRIGELEMALKNLADEAIDSVEYSDWPELQEAVRRADEVLREGN